jgi:hypothetical protein
MEPRAERSNDLQAACLHLAPASASRGHEM